MLCEESSHLLLENLLGRLFRLGGLRCVAAWLVVFFCFKNWPFTHCSSTICHVTSSELSFKALP